MRKTRILSLAMCLVMLLSCVPSFALASGTSLLTDEFTVEGVTSREHQSIQDWNGWSFASGSLNTALGEDKRTTYTIEKDDADADKSFENANKVIKVHSYAKKQEQNLYAIKTFEDSYTGKFRISFTLDGSNATILSDATDTGKYLHTTNTDGSPTVLPIKIQLGNNDTDNYQNDGILGQLEISAKDITNYYGEYTAGVDGEGQPTETYAKKTEKQSSHVYSKLEVVFDVDTTKNKYSTYIYKADGTAMASFVDKALLKPEGTTTVAIETLRFIIDKGCFIDAYWTVDDIKVEEYNATLDLTQDANWELSEKEDFQSVDQDSYTEYSPKVWSQTGTSDDKTGWNKFFKDNGWNGWTLFTDDPTTAINQNHTQYNIIKDPAAEEGKWDVANKYLQLKSNPMGTGNNKNLRIKKTFSKTYNGRYRIKFKLNGADQTPESQGDPVNGNDKNLKFRVSLGKSETLNYYDQYRLFNFGVHKGYVYVGDDEYTKNGDKTDISVKYDTWRWNIGVNENWQNFVIDVDSENKKFSIQRNTDKPNTFTLVNSTDTKNADEVMRFNEHVATNKSKDVNMISFFMDNRNSNYDASWYLDDFEIWTPKYWQVTETDDVTKNLYTNEKTVSEYGNAWSEKGDARVSLAGVDNTALKLINAATVSKDFTATEGVITATAKLRTADVAGKENKAGAISMLLRDSDGSPLTQIDISSYNFAYSSDKFTGSLVGSSQNLVVDEALYAADEWFTLKVEANTDKRTYDVYVNSSKTDNADKKIGANLPFYNTVTPSKDNGKAAQLAFITKDGRTWFVDDVKVEQTAAPETGIYGMTYKKSDDTVVLSPVNGGKVSSVKVRVPSSGTAKVFVAVYDKDGNIFDVGTNSTPITVDGGLYNVNVDVSFPETDANLCNVRAFFWDGTSLKPFGDTVSLNEPENVTVYIAAASLSESYDVYKYPMMGWGDALRHYVDMEKVTIDNRAMGGRSTKTFIDEGRLDKIGKTIKKGDYLLVSFCHNDSEKSKIDSYVPLDSTGTKGTDGYVKGYKEYVEDYIDFAKEHQANIIWVAPAARASKFGDGENNGIVVEGETNADLKKYTEEAKKICDDNGVPYIDVFNYTLDKKNINSTNYTQWYSLMSANDTERYAGDLLFAASKYGTVAGSNSDDTTHLQAYGAQMIAKYIADFIKNGKDKNGNPWNFSIEDSIDLTFTPTAK